MAVCWLAAFVPRTKTARIDPDGDAVNHKHSNMHVCPPDANKIHGKMDDM